MRRVLVVIALVACQSHRDEPARRAPASDPWATPAPPTEHTAPTFVERHQFVDEVCPKVSAPWFYRIEKSGHVSYILGTRHISVSLDKFPRVVRDRLHDAKLAVFEVDPADKDHPKPHALDVDQDLGPELWARYVALVGPELAHRAQHAHPSLAILLAASLYDDLSVQLEKQLESELTDAHVPMRGLETARFQVALLERLLDERMLRALITQTTDRAQIERDARKSLARYCTGTDKSSELSEEDRAKMRAAGYTDAELDAFERELVYDRTASWVPTLEQLFADGGVFVAVGAGHVRGDKGLARLLEQRGWKVTRIAE